MRSDFKLFVSAAVVGAGCYVLASANGNTVLVLLMVASFAWCLWSWQLERRRALTAGGSPSAIQRIEARTNSYFVEPAKEVSQPSEPKVVAHGIRRFPISKLAQG